MAKKHRKVPRYEKESKHVKQEAEGLKTVQARAEQAKSRIQADLSRQAPHNSYGGVPLYYEDLEFTCTDCGRQETWTTRQQQWWYEVAQGAIYSTAVRCRACRRARRGRALEDD
jgi:Probable zinc-ribbon domain